MFCRCVRTVERIVHQRSETGEVRLLLQHDDTHVRLHLALAAVGFEPIVDQSKQGGLAGAVATDERHSIARPDMQVERIMVRSAEQPAATLLQSDVFER